MRTIFRCVLLIVHKHTLVFRHYVKHCRLADTASIREAETAGELAGEWRPSLCAFSRRGCTLAPGNFGSRKPSVWRIEDAVVQRNSTLCRSRPCIPSRGNPKRGANHHRPVATLLARQNTNTTVACSQISHSSSVH